jgi:hypothetical protein
MVIKAGELRINQTFRTRLTGRRGVVLDIRQIVDGHDERGRTVMTHAPRALMVGPNGVVTQTVHPDVLVEI